MSESYSTRGRSRHNIENSLFGLGMNNGGRETRERDREAEREAKEQRKVEREKERLKERERSLREENVDGIYYSSFPTAMEQNAGEGQGNGVLIPSGAIRWFLSYPRGLYRR